MTSAPTDPPNPDEVARFAFRVWSYKQGEMVSLLVHLGDRLGLYRVLDGAGPVTAEDLASRTGLHPRWLHEWLRGNAAADLLASDDGEQFELTARRAPWYSRAKRTAFSSRPALSARRPNRHSWTTSPTPSAPAPGCPKVDGVIGAA